MKNHIEPSAPFVDLELEDVVIEEDSRFKNIVLAEDLWRNHYQRLAKISRKIRHKYTNHLNETSPTYRDQLECNKHLAQSQSHRDEHYVRGVQCFGNLFAKRRMYLFNACLKNRGSLEKCDTKLKELETAVAHRLKDARDTSVDMNTRMIQKFCDNESRMLGFTEERRHLVLFACIAPKMCPVRHVALSECYMNNKLTTVGCEKEVDDLFKCHITKHWENASEYYELLDKGQI